MLKIKVTEKSGASIEYQSEQMIDPSKMGHGLPERPEIGEDGEPTGNILPAEYTIEVIDITAEHELAECLAKRKAEYPSAEEFLNAFFDGGQVALDGLQQKRLEIKAKYPKP